MVYYVFNLEIGTRISEAKIVVISETSSRECSTLRKKLFECKFHLTNMQGMVVIRTSVLVLKV